MTDRTSFAISISTALKMFAEAQACRRGVSVEDFIASLIDRERSHCADDEARQRMQDNRNLHQPVLTALRALRDDFSRPGAEDRNDTVLRILRCVTGKGDRDRVALSDVSPDSYPRVLELVDMIRANGGKWPDVPSALCRQESLVGPGEDDGL